MEIAIGRLRTLGLITVAFCTLVMSYATPASTSACTGGVAFDWAVAHQQGGIVRAVVESKLQRPDHTDDIVVTDAEAIRGDPTLPFAVNVAAGLPCEQVGDVGEAILILYDIRGGEVPITIPLYYVVSGPDALSPAVLNAGLGPTAPSTDTKPASGGLQTSRFDWLALWVVSALAMGFALTGRSKIRRPGL